MLDLDFLAKIYLIVACAGVATLAAVGVVCYLLLDRCTDNSDSYPRSGWRFSRDERIHLRAFRSSSSTASTASLTRPPDKATYWSTASQDSGRHSIASSVASVHSVHEPANPYVNLTLQLLPAVTPARADAQTSTTPPETSTLVIQILDCGHVPPRDYIDRCNLLASVWLLRKSSAEPEHCGSGYVRTNDSSTPANWFTCRPQISNKYVKDCQLRIDLEDDDKLTMSRRIVGTLRLKLSPTGGVAEALESGVMTQLIRRLTPAAEREELGQAFVGLSFLPTSQRLVVDVAELKCSTPRRLRRQASPESSVRLHLFLLNESGRVLKRRSGNSITPPADHDAPIDVQQSFHFKLDVDRWQHCVLLVCARIQKPEQPELGAGYTALGKNVAGIAQRIHWNSAFLNPRKAVTQWHPLY